jgi:hypothetical protein
METVNFIHIWMMMGQIVLYPEKKEKNNVNELRN